MADDDATRTENLTIRLLRDIQRTLAAHGARMDSIDDSIAGLRQELHGMRGEFGTLREFVKSAINQQHAILGNNSVLIDEIDERLRALEAERRQN